MWIFSELGLGLLSTLLALLSTGILFGVRLRVRIARRLPGSFKAETDKDFRVTSDVLGYASLAAAVVALVLFAGVALPVVVVGLIVLGLVLLLVVFLVR